MRVWEGNNRADFWHFSSLQIRAAEDILSLTRILKEAWLFGKLQTVGASEAETRAEAAAEKVAAGLGRLQGGKGAEGAELRGETIGVDGDGEGVGEEGEGQAAGL